MAISTAEPALILKRVTHTAIAVAACLLMTEGGLRLAGRRPAIRSEVDVRVEPGGRFYAPHPTLGYSHLPGRYRVILKKEIVFEVNHLEDALRATSGSRRLEGVDTRPQIWIFGGSYTHGWGVDDDETYPWLVQEHFPHAQVINFGVGGYGTIHFLIQLREALASRPAPRMVVVTYSGFHAARNVFSMQRNKTLARWDFLGLSAVPFARLDEAGNLGLFMAEVDYRQPPLIEFSALVHEFERALIEARDREHRPLEVTRALFQQISREVRAHGVPLY